MMVLQLLSCGVLRSDDAVKQSLDPLKAFFDLPGFNGVRYPQSGGSPNESPETTPTLASLKINS
jgi:hypothetical protein